MKKLAVALALASCSMAAYAQDAQTAPTPAHVAAAPVAVAQVAPEVAPAPAAAPAGDLETLAVMATLKGKYPATNFTNVAKSPLSGIFEITMGKNIAYTDSEGRYLMFGSLYDMQTRQDLTAPKRAAAEKVDVTKFPLADAFTRVKGDGSRKIYLFSDPDCPYCHQLETDVFANVDNVTIYTFMYPLDSLHPNARAKAESIWCMPEAGRAAGWDAMMRGQAPVAKKCDNPIERNVALGQSLGVQGTPTMFAEDGRKLPGMVPAERIEAWLKGA
ncbi:DsbC family protein [Pseudomonas abietaniphila]|uniref:Thiol:disulfide interchange protein n=1 Tax=Pseudomonas abietaniphila TaxID=89065 RepID=A0A1G8QPI9_9PSED|nr:DsbC family protein [Pseudomonas abietaniphila]SDJ06694.1 thiol:disulfide interchange protein DsbC [Pseudomonas abietaniphila]